MTTNWIYHSNESPCPMRFRKTSAFDLARFLYRCTFCIGRLVAVLDGWRLIIGIGHFF